MQLSGDEAGRPPVAKSATHGGGPREPAGDGIPGQLFGPGDRRQADALDAKGDDREYYRLSITSTGETDWRLELPTLLQNSHLRVLAVNGIEIHLQSMAFRAIEFDEPGTASFSFTPIRPGTYRFTIGRNPIAQGLPAGTAGVQEPDRRAEGRFIVE